MKIRNIKSTIAVIATALIIVVCSVCACVFSKRTNNIYGFNGTYNLNAYAAVNTNKITVSNNNVDIVETINFEDDNYSLYVTVIDTADLAGLNVQVGYGFGEGLYFNGCGNEGLSTVVYSSLSSGDSTLSVSDFGLDEETFTQPYFVIVEVAKNSILDKIGSLIVALRHNIEKVEGQAATCTADGWKDYYTCTDAECTKNFADKYAIKEITDLDAWKAGDGKIVATGHTDVVDAAVAATCTEDGKTQGSHCSVCGTVTVAQETVKANGHTEVIDEAVAATCTATGLTEGKHCSVCGTVTVAQETVKANGHTEVVDAAVAATCTEDGKTQGSHCSVCGTVTVAQETVKAKGHTEVVDAAVAATCTEDGKTQGSHCSVCGTVTVAQTLVEAKGHTEVTDEAVAATCTATGLTEGKHCSVCNTVLTAQTEIPAKGHTTSVVSGQAATCTEDGWNDYYTCSVCGSRSSDENGENVIADLETWKVGDGKLDAFGHSYINYICTTCGDLEKVAVNGVYYQFTANEGDSGYHFVAYGKADGFSKYTGASAETLILENEIGGYPVTEIAANAFANTDNVESTAIKSVIVPEKITTIGERAFLDNVGMQKVVFLAPQVTMAGSFSEGEDGNTTPFYGCSLTENGTSTALKVYYNSVVYSGSTTDLRWTRFRRYESSPAIYHRYYIGCDPRDTAIVDYDHNGGGTLHSSGWDYVTASATVDLGGITGSSLTKEAAEDILSRFYPLVSNTTFTGSTEIENALAVDFAQFDMTKNGITYKCVFTPTQTTVGSYTHVTYSVSYTAATIITVYSGVEFTYYGKTVKANTSTLIPVPVADNKISLATPSATGYTFLGYAYDNNGVLTFGVGEDIVAAGNTLYIIWGHSKVGTAFSVVTNTAGSALYMPSGTGIDGKWYDNSWNEVTTISTANTVVYTRSIFTFTYKVKGKWITKITDSLYGKSVSGKDNYSNSFQVLEGQKVTGVRSRDGYYMTLSLDGVAKTTLGLEKYVVRYKFNDESYDSGVIAGDVSVTFNYGN